MRCMCVDIMVEETKGSNAKGREEGDSKSGQSKGPALAIVYHACMQKGCDATTSPFRSAREKLVRGVRCDVMIRSARL